MILNILDPRFTIKFMFGFNMRENSSHYIVSVYLYVFEIKVALNICVLREHPLKYMLMEVCKISLKRRKNDKLKTKSFFSF